ncbi:MAG: type II secretion system F family protein [Halorientalis sp.]
MVAPLVLLPLAVPAALLAILLAARRNEALGRWRDRLARAAFGRFVDESDVERKRLLQSAYVAAPYGTFAATTYLYAVVLAVVGGVLGAYAVAGFVLAVPAIGDLLGGFPRTIRGVLASPRSWELTLSRDVFLALCVGSGVLATLATGPTVHALRWQLLATRAEARRRRINEGLARTVAFLFALTRGGMPFPKALATLAANRHVYGETAAELTVTAREMELFGTDVITALRETTERTPSDEFKTFGENLASVLQSGQQLPQFLDDQYQRYQEAAHERQEEVLELLSTLAEAYVTVFVAGTLFLITVLLVFGLTTTDTLWILQGLAYLVLPLANVGFIVFLGQRLSLLGIGGGTGTVPRRPAALLSTDAPTSARVADGGYTPALRPNLERLAVYDRLERVRQYLRTPHRTVLRRPELLLSVTVPVALVVTAARIPGTVTGAGVNIRALDDVVVQAVLFVLGTYAVARYLSQRRLARIEAATPEFLDRLASLNEAGMSVVESFERVRGGDLGALSGEVERMWRDVSLGANVEDALWRFGTRVRTTPITRAVTLLANAMRASGSLGAVLRIASRQSRADLRLKRRRSREMLTYLVVIYVSFAVFLVIIVAVQEVLVPSLPDSVPTPPQNTPLGVDATQFTRLGSVNKAAYTLVFFHTALIQAVLSGLVGGQIGEGTVRDGVKHAAIMLGIAYVVFVLLSSPVASINMGTTYANDHVTIETVELSEGGFIVVHTNTPTGEVVGRSGYIPAGRSGNITIEFDQSVRDDTTIFAVPHRDTNDNRRFDYVGGGPEATDGPYPPGREEVAARTRILPGPAPLEFPIEE